MTFNIHNHYLMTQIRHDSYEHKYLIQYLYWHLIWISIYIVLHLWTNVHRKNHNYYLEPWGFIYLQNNLPRVGPSFLTVNRITFSWHLHIIMPLSSILPVFYFIHFQTVLHRSLYMYIWLYIHIYIYNNAIYMS